MIQDGEKPKGKFLKNSGNLIKNVDIREYDFAKIAVTSVTPMDNESSNIVHHRLHEPEDLGKTISQDCNVYENIPDPGGRNPVIMPRDFTKDWKAIRDRQIRGSDEDDDEEDDDEPTDAELNEIKNLDIGNHEESNKKSETSEEEQAKEVFESNLDELQTPQKEFVITKESDENQADLTINKEESHEPGEPPINNEVVDGLKAEIELLKGELQESNQKKAELDERSSKLEKLCDQMNQALQENTNFERSSLEKARGQFSELAQLILNNLLQKGIRLAPENLEAIYQQLVQQNLKSADYKIFFSSNDLLLLKEIPTFDAEKMLEDSNLNEGAFRIESENGEIETDLNSIVQGMLEQSEFDPFGNK